MNPRIQELIEESRVQNRGFFLYQYGGPNGHQSVEQAIDMEKFAQLIVQECIAQIALLGVSNSENDDVSWAVDTATKNIRRRFGEKE